MTATCGIKWVEDPLASRFFDPDPIVSDRNVDFPTVGELVGADRYFTFVILREGVNKGVLNNILNNLTKGARIAIHLDVRRNIDIQTVRGVFELALNQGAYIGHHYR
jgi:hypothetical protein